MINSAPVPYAAWTRVALDVLERRYPYATAHVSADEHDHLIDPVRLHPAFYGSFDWHSSVHMQWSLVQLLSAHGVQLVEPGLAHSAAALLRRRLAPETITVEVDYLKNHPGYERPYGWAWAAALAATCAEHAQDLDRLGSLIGDTDLGHSLASATAPLWELIGDKIIHWLPRQTYPVRHGVHANSAFALILMHQAFQTSPRTEVVDAIEQQAIAWFDQDRAADTRTEPSGTDFLSPTLTQAELMHRVLPAEQFRGWFERFLPGLGEGGHAHLFALPQIADLTDGQLVHLLGCALSRAWQLRSLALVWPGGDPRTAVLTAAADRLEAAARPQVTDGDFMATHWLVSFALLAALAH